MTIEFQENTYVVAYCYEVENPMDALAPDAEHFSAVCCPADGFAQQRAVTAENEVLVIQYYITAANWEECMTIFNLREHGVNNYDVGEGELCPKCERFFYYPECTGHCPKCGKIE